MSGYGSGAFYNNPQHPMHGIPLRYAEDVGVFGGGRGYASHFFTWEGPGLVGEAGGWTLHSITGPGGASAALIDTSADGVLRLTTSAETDANALLELDSRFIYSSDKKLYCFASIALSDANDMEAFFGLGAKGLQDFVAAFPAHGLFFEKAETATDWDFHARSSGTSTERSATMSITLADDTFRIVGFAVDGGTGTVSHYTETTLTNTRWTEGTSIASTDTNLPNASGEEMSLYFGIETGAGAADYMDIDWVCVWQEV